MNVCSFCGKPVTASSSSAYRKVEGWERIRGKNDGVFPILGRKILGPPVHEVCLEISLTGGRQEGLAFGETSSVALGSPQPTPRDVRAADQSSPETP